MRTVLALLVAGVVMIFADRARSQEIPQPGVRSATAFVERMDCDAGAPSVVFAIPGQRQFGRVPDAVWIDISLLNNNFAPGTFLGAGPFTVDHDLATFFRWERLAVAPHFYRLNGLVGGRWSEIGRGSFETPNCGPVRFIGCDPVSGETATNHVHFAVAPAGPIPPRTPREQWFDLTLQANPRNPLLDGGFAPGTFLGAGPFPPEGTMFEWQGIAPGRRHYYRQNTRYFLRPADPDTWVTQFSGSFVSLSCAGRPERSPTRID
jgi:hypothetical protein